MRRMIGFMAGNESGAESHAVSTASRTIMPVKSLVKVRFAQFPTDLAYYNDRFDLREGDVVYVSGKLAGNPGIVVSVSTKFRIHTSDYERVLSLLDLTIHGSFTRVSDKMVSFNQIAVTPEQFGSWITPPEDPRKKKDETEDEDEVISGEGYSIDINHIESCSELTSAIAERGVHYCKEGRVRYLCIQNGEGTAFVEGNKWYQVDFRFSEGMMTDLYCDCPYPGLCKHEMAVALTLQMLFKQSRFEHAQDFMALDHQTFWQLASRGETIEL